jgi:hypothetical protein
MHQALFYPSQKSALLYFQKYGFFKRGLRWDWDQNHAMFFPVKSNKGFHHASKTYPQ